MYDSRGQSIFLDQVVLSFKNMNLCMLRKCGGGDRFSEKAANMSQNMSIENGFNHFNASKLSYQQCLLCEYLWLIMFSQIQIIKNVIYFNFFSGEEVHFMHICESSTDQTPINDLLQLAGVKQVSFPNDTRVIDV